MSRPFRLIGKSWRRLAGALLAALLVCCYLTSSVSSAISTDTKQSTSRQHPQTIAMQLKLGFDALIRPGYWLPIYLTFTNSGKVSFNGRLEVMTYNSAPGGRRETVPSDQHYLENVQLPIGQKSLTLYLPLTGPQFNEHGIIANLFGTNGQLVSSQKQDTYILNSSDISIGLLSERGDHFAALKQVSLPGRANGPNLSILDASTLPTLTRVLQNFEVIILDDFPTSNLQPAQLQALQTWVNQGGVLLEIGGPHWQRTLAPLPPDLLPVNVQGTSELPAGSHLLMDNLPGEDTTQGDVYDQPLNDIAPDMVIVSNGTLRPSDEDEHASAFTDETVLASDTLPLLVQAHQGQGQIYYLAFDPTSAPLENRSELQPLWQHLLMRMLGDRLLISTLESRYTTSPGAILARGGIFATLEPTPGPTIWILTLLLISYLAILGPVRLLFIRTLARQKRPFWSWRVVASSIVVFSLLAYGLAYYQKGAALLANSFSITQLNQSGQSAHTLTYIGIFVPGQGDFIVNMPLNSLAQPVSYPLYSTGPAVPLGDPSTPISYSPSGTSIALLNSAQWSTHTLVNEQDQQLHGGISSQLTLHNGHIVGSISNTLTKTLSDVYILLPQGVARVGSLPTGKASKIDLPIASIAPGSSIASYIATSNGLPQNYFPYTHGRQPQTPQQRHIAQLAALNGSGYLFTPCYGSCQWHDLVDVSKDTIIMPETGTMSMQSTKDPLLLPGTTATLIGWADQPLDGMDSLTINGQRQQGTHDNMLQAPLNLSLQTPEDAQPGLLKSHLIEASGNNIKTVLSDIYTLTSGSLSFEFTLPTIANAQIKGIAITIPGASNGMGGTQARLYNWQSGKWDLFILARDRLTSSNMESYVGSGGRILLQMGYQGKNNTPLYFGKPWLSLGA